MAEFDYGLPAALTFDMQFDKRINDLRYDEQALAGIRARNEVKRNLFLDDLDYQNAQNQFDNPLIKEKMRNKLFELGRYVNQNPDWNTDVNKMMVVKDMRRSFKDDPDLIRGLAVDTQYKELVKDMQEAAKDPTYKDLGAYEEQLNQFKNYFATGNKAGVKGTIDPPSYIRPRDFTDLSESAQKRGKMVEQNRYTMDYVPLNNGRIDAFYTAPKPQVVDALAQQEYKDHQRQYDVQYGKDALNAARRFVLSSIKGERFEGYADEEGMRKRLIDYETRKKQSVENPGVNPYLHNVVNTNNIGVSDSDELAATFGSTPTVKFVGPDGNMITESGNEFKWTGLRDKNYDPKKPYQKDGLKVGDGFILKPLDWAKENNILKDDKWFGEKLVVKPEYAGTYEIWQPASGEPMIKIRASTEVNAHDPAAERKYNSYIKSTTKQRDFAGGDQFMNTGPAIGTEQGGYKFMGGDPASQSSWKKL